jgi:hypothetical protein
MQIKKTIFLMICVLQFNLNGYGKGPVMTNDSKSEKINKLKIKTKSHSSSDFSELKFNPAPLKIIAKVKKNRPPAHSNKTGDILLNGFVPTDFLLLKGKVLWKEKLKSPYIPKYLVYLSEKEVTQNRLLERVYHYSGDHHSNVNSSQNYFYFNEKNSELFFLENRNKNQDLKKINIHSKENSKSELVFSDYKAGYFKSLWMNHLDSFVLSGYYANTHPGSKNPFQNFLIQWVNLSDPPQSISVLIEAVNRNSHFLAQKDNILYLATEDHVFGFSPKGSLSFSYLLDGNIEKFSLSQNGEMCFILKDKKNNHQLLLVNQKGESSQSVLVNKESESFVSAPLISLQGSIVLLTEKMAQYFDSNLDLKFQLNFKDVPLGGLIDKKDNLFIVFKNKYEVYNTKGELKLSFNFSLEKGESVKAFAFGPDSIFYYFTQYSHLSALQ